MELLNKDLTFKYELLDKGTFHKIKSDNLTFSIKILLACIIGVFLLFLWMGELSDLVYSFLMIGPALVGILLLLYLKNNEIQKIKQIDDNTVEFQKFTVSCQIISKSMESTTTVNGNRDSVSGDTTHRYIVGVRSTHGNLLTINSKQLYIGSVQGEFVDVLIKQKLDRNDMLLDASYTPLIETIRAAL